MERNLKKRTSQLVQSAEGMRESADHQAEGNFLVGVPYVLRDENNRYLAVLQETNGALWNWAYMNTYTNVSKDDLAIIYFIGDYFQGYE